MMKKYLVGSVVMLLLGCIAAVPSYSQLLPPEPTNYLEKLSYHERITRFNTFDTLAHVSMSDKMKTMSTVEEYDVSLFLLPDSSVVEYRTIDSIALQDHWQAIKTVVTKNGIISNYDLVDSLKGETTIADFDSLNTLQKQSSLTLPYISVDSSIILMYLGAGYIHSSPSQSKTVFKKDYTSVIIEDIDSTVILSREDSLGVEQFLSKTRFVDVGHSKVFDAEIYSWSKKDYHNDVTGSEVTIISRTSFTYDIPVLPFLKNPANESAIDDFQVYPMPANDYFTVSLPRGYDFDNSRVTVDIISIEGVRLRSLTKNGNSFNVLISDLPKGNYFLQVFRGEDRFIKKITKI